MGKDQLSQIELNFKATFFDNFKQVTPCRWSPELKRLIDSSEKITTMEEFGEFRKSLLRYACTAINEDDTLAVCHLLLTAFTFLISPLSDNELEQLKQISIEEDKKCQLVLLASSLDIIECNKKVYPIFMKVQSDIPSMDTSGIPLMGVKLITSILTSLLCGLMYLKCPLLRDAANCFFIAAPALFFANDQKDANKFCQMMNSLFVSFGHESIDLFYMSLYIRFNYKMMRDWKQLIAQDESSVNCLNFTAMVFTIILNKEEIEKISTDGKEVLSMLDVVVKGGRNLVFRFLNNIDIDRLLYKMKSIYRELKLKKAELSSNEELVKLDTITEAMSYVLMAHLYITADKPYLGFRMPCRLIEFFTAWTNSADLMVNLALRWVTLSEYSMAAGKVVDLLLHLINKMPDFLLHPTTDCLYENAFLLRTCQGVIFPRDKYRFLDLVIKCKSNHPSTYGTSIPNIFDGLENLDDIQDSRQLSAVLTSLYFNSPLAASQAGILKCSYYNVCREELLNRNFPKDETEFIRVNCTTIKLENEEFVRRTELVISQSKFYGHATESYEVETETQECKKKGKSSLYQDALKKSLMRTFR